MTRLNQSTLPDARAIRPGYVRRGLATGIVHLGIGAFHRAHQAVYTEQALAAGDRRWGILGASLRSPDTSDALNPQDGLYTLSIRDASGEKLQIIGAITRVVVAPEDREASRLLLLNRGFKSRDGFAHRIFARLGDEAIVCCIRGTR